MTYETIANNAVDVSKMVNSYGDISRFFPAIFWLSELYREMSTKGEITKIKDIQSSRQLVYWTEVCLTIPEKPKWLRILAAHACYMDDLIKEKK